MTTGTNACFTPITIGTKTAANRFAVQPMEFNDAVGGEDPDNRGNPTQRTLNRYRNLFAGGAGLIVLEAILVGDTSMARTHQLTIVPRNAKALAAFVAELRQVNAKPVFVAQLTHSAKSAAPSPSVSRRSRWPVSNRSCSATRTPTGSSTSSSKRPRSLTMSAWTGST